MSVARFKVGDVCWYVDDGIGRRELVRVVVELTEFVDDDPFYTVSNGTLSFHAWPDDLESYEPVDVTDNAKVEQWLG